MVFCNVYYSNFLLIFHKLLKKVQLKEHQKLQCLL